MAITTMDPHIHITRQIIISITTLIQLITLLIIILTLTTNSIISNITSRTINNSHIIIHRIRITDKQLDLLERT